MYGGTLDLQAPVVNIGGTLQFTTVNIGNAFAFLDLAEDYIMDGNGKPMTRKYVVWR